jgi:hypothetical protein
LAADGRSDLQAPTHERSSLRSDITLTSGYDFGIIRPAVVYECIKYDTPTGERTQVYAGYFKLDNDRRAGYVFNNNAYTVNTSCQVTCTQGSNGKPAGFVLGMIDLF